MVIPAAIYLFPAPIPTVKHLNQEEKKLQMDSGQNDSSEKIKGYPNE
jgi:hypothetical protein